MTININKSLLKELKKENLTIASWVFLLSLYKNEELFEYSDVENYAFLSQNLTVLGLIKLSNKESDELYEITEKGEELINKLI